MSHGMYLSLVPFFGKILGTLRVSHYALKQDIEVLFRRYYEDAE